ncbi:MAG: hypothetical protein WCS94_02320 [Verrucomicrobiota bacterium]
MKPKLILVLALVLIGGLFGCSTVHHPLEKSKQSPMPSGNLAKAQTDEEIRQKLIGTWVGGGSCTSTNEAESFTWNETLKYATNGGYSKTKTIVGAGKTRVEKCQGIWSFKSHILTYSVTDSMGIKPDLDLEPFFYTQAKIIWVKSEQLFLIERSHCAYFERFHSE